MSRGIRETPGSAALEFEDMATPSPEDQDAKDDSPPPMAGWLGLSGSAANCLVAGGITTIDQLATWRTTSCSTCATWEAELDVETDRRLISALVVEKDSGRPSHGFWALCRDLGLADAVSTDARREEFRLGEVQRCWDVYGATPGH